MSEQFRESAKMVLLPCPFCGGEAIISTNLDGVKDSQGRFWAYTVVCTKCAASSGLCYREDMAIEAWNTRRPMEKIVEQLELEKHNNPQINGRYSGLQKAIEIVQKGGAE